MTNISIKANLKRSSYSEGVRFGEKTQHNTTQHNTTLDPNLDSTVAEPELEENYDIDLTPAVPDLEEYCLQELSYKLHCVYEYTGRKEYEKRSISPYWASHCYTIGYYNRALHGEKKQLFVDEVGILPFNTLYNDYYFNKQPKTKLSNRSGRTKEVILKHNLLTGTSDKLYEALSVLEELKLSKWELDCYYRFNTHKELLEFIIYGTMINKYFWESVFGKDIDLSLEDNRHLKDQIEPWEGRIPYIEKVVNEFFNNMLDVEDVLRKKINTLRKYKTKGLSKQARTPKYKPAYKKYNPKFESGKLNVKTHSLEAIKRAYEIIDDSEYVLTVAEHAYKIGYLDRAFKTEELKLKQVKMDKPFKEFLENIQNILDGKYQGV